MKQIIEGIRVGVLAAILIALISIDIDIKELIQGLRKDTANVLILPPPYKEDSNDEDVI